MLCVCECEWVCCVLKTEMAFCFLVAILNYFGFWIILDHANIKNAPKPNEYLLFVCWFIRKFKWLETRNSLHGHCLILYEFGIYSFRVLFSFFLSFLHLVRSFGNLVLVFSLFRWKMLYTRFPFHRIVQWAEGGEEGAGL